MHIITDINSYKMTELDEMTDGKSLNELQEQLEFQLANGEYMGGTICSHILHQMTLRCKNFIVTKKFVIHNLKDINNLNQKI